LRLPSRWSVDTVHAAAGEPGSAGPPMRPLAWALGLINQSDPLPSSLADPRVKAASEYMQIIAETRPSPCVSRENQPS
jgi:hypothetical protein